MKFYAFAISIFIAHSFFAQQSEDLIPKEAISVFSINNINLLQVVSLDELIDYDFMEEVQQEIFDHSTDEKTIKDIGIDFDQKMNIFSGRGENYEVNGLTFGIVDKNALFEVFDDYEKVESTFDGYEVYASFFNRIAIKGNIGILFNIVPDSKIINEITDSIWYARGNEYPWYSNNDYLYEDDYYEVTEEYEVIEEMESEENTSAPIDAPLPPAEADPIEKTYYELLDSVEVTLRAAYISSFGDNLFNKHENLIQIAPLFKDRLSATSEGLFYVDNGRNFVDGRDFRSIRKNYPSFYTDIKELYDGNVILGELVLEEEAIKLNATIHYGEKLGSIYTELSDSKFDENILKYISKDDIGYATYNINMQKAYEKALEIMIPILEKSEEKEIVASLLVIEILDEFLNKDAIFNTYNGSMFGVYSGIEKIATKKYIFNYDEETFEYEEELVEAEEDMPVFAYGFTTKSNEFSIKILSRIEKLNDEMYKEKDYWVIENGMLNAANLYLILKNDLFIVTNNEDLANKYSNGYGSNSIAKDKLTQLKENGTVYAHVNLEELVDGIPSDLLNNRDKEMLELLKGKSGQVELTSSKSTASSTIFDLNYTIEGKYDNSGVYILDLINSFYVLSK